MNDTSLDHVTAAPGATQEAPSDLFASSDLDRLGLRVTRAEFAKLMGTSRQAVTLWTQQGRITVGTDGRFDPRQAVAQLLRTGDPARIRSRVLAPIVNELSQQRDRLAQLERELAEAKENAEFYEMACNEWDSLVEAIRFHLEVSWRELRAADECAALAAINAWITKANEVGVDLGLTISDYLPRAAEHQKGGGDFAAAACQMSARPDDAPREE